MRKSKFLSEEVFNKLNTTDKEKVLRCEAKYPLYKPRNVEKTSDKQIKDVTIKKKAGSR
jgi:hypothetical protein